MHRRQLLAMTPALALGAVSLSLIPASARAQAAPAQFRAVQRYSLGDWTVTALGDGYLPLDPSVLLGITPEEAQAHLRAAHQDPARMYGAVNAYVLETGSELILIDTGSGATFGPTLGRLADNLREAGHDPAQVTRILCTHLHPDHIGGCALDGGNPFPRAEFLVSAPDHAFFTSDTVRASAPEPLRPFFDLAGQVLTGFGERVSLFQPGADVAPGITSVALPGHTPGHCGFLLDSGAGSLLIWGDLVHLPAIQFARPEVGLTFDTDPAQAAATRAQTLDRAATDGVMVAGMHLLFPGFGYVERAASGYRFAPAPWDYV